jgi:UPF0755 protein
MYKLQGLKSSLRYMILAILLAVVMLAYVWREIVINPLPVSSNNHTFELAPGTSLKQFTKQLKDAKIFPHANMLRWFAVYKGQANSLKAGEYTITAALTAEGLLNKIVRGEVTQYAFTIVEGWKTATVIAALHASPKIKNTLFGLNEQQIIEKLSIPVPQLEGVLLPDTYYYTARTTDVDFLRRAYFNMQDALQNAWGNRSPDCVLKSPYEALILASIIEKESGVKDEYHEISGVFQRRLAKKMRLQADPTVIYALGDKYNNTLLKGHLKIKSPYNTYVVHGLPPTPIAIPGILALEAALHPAKGDSLYFVATGDGGHVFTKDLLSHNKAVQKYKERLSVNSVNK